MIGIFHWENVLNFDGHKKMADTSKDGLLLGGGIHHITTSQLHRCSRVEGNELLLVYVIVDCLNTFIFGNISPDARKNI